MMTLFEVVHLGEGAAEDRTMRLPRSICQQGSSGVCCSCDESGRLVH